MLKQVHLQESSYEQRLTYVVTEKCDTYAKGITLFRKFETTENVYTGELPNEDATKNQDALMDFVRPLLNPVLFEFSDLTYTEDEIVV